MRAISLALAALVLMAGGRAAAAGPAPQVDAAVAEAAAAFDLPEAWIRRVMARESGGDPRAVSPAGALGLMQLMPATWDEMRSDLGLGEDPLAVRDNVLAGAGYLRRMLDRFGSPGFLAAYNAGPGRYAQALAGRGRLPRETRNYLAELAPSIGRPDARAAQRSRPSLIPSHAGLFPPLGPARP